MKKKRTISKNRSSYKKKSKKSKTSKRKKRTKTKSRTNTIETTELKISRLNKEIDQLNEQIVGLKLKLNEDKSDELKKLQNLIERVANQVSIQEASFIQNVGKIGKYTADIEQLKKDPFFS